MRPINRVGVALIIAAAALAGTAGLSRTMALGPYHHDPQKHDPNLGARASSLNALDASLERALESPLPPLPRMVEARRAPARPRPGGSRATGWTATSTHRAPLPATRQGSGAAVTPSPSRPARAPRTRTPAAPATRAPVPAPSPAPPSATPSRTDPGAGSRRRPAPPAPPSHTPQPAPGAGSAASDSSGGADHEGQ